MMVAVGIDLPPWLTDVSVLTTLITALSTVMGGFLVALVQNLANRKDKQNELRDAKLEGGLNKLGNMVQEVQNTMDGIVETTDAIRESTKITQRYRLYHDLTKALLQGYTDRDSFRELSKLFDSYQSLGGNGEIEKLFRKYEQLPYDFEIKKGENVANSD